MSSSETSPSMLAVHSPQHRRHRSSEIVEKDHNQKHISTTKTLKPTVSSYYLSNVLDSSGCCLQDTTSLICTIQLMMNDPSYYRVSLDSSDFLELPFQKVMDLCSDLLMENSDDNGNNSTPWVFDVVVSDGITTRLDATEITHALHYLDLLAEEQREQHQSCDTCSSKPWQVEWVFQNE